MKRCVSLLQIVLVLSVLVAGCAPAPTPTLQLIQDDAFARELAPTPTPQVIEKVVKETVIVEVEKPVEVVKEVPVIDFSTDLDDQNEPVGATAFFSLGVDMVCGSFLPPSPLPDGTNKLRARIGFGGVWDDLELEDEFAREFASASSSGRIGFCFYAQGLSSHEYAVEVHDADGNLLASGTFIVEVEKPVKVVKEVPVIDFSTDLDDQNEPVGAASSFPQGVEKICGFFLPESDISIRLLGGVDVHFEDCLIGELDLAREFASASPSGRIGFCFYARELPPGEHTIEVYDADGNLIAAGPLKIEE